MRPRRIRRGEQEKTRFALQITRSFNAATANSPWRTHGSRRLRGTQTSFNAATANSPWRTAAKDVLVSRYDLASMRPRRIRRGGPGQGISRIQGNGASMRPRRIRRGEPRKYLKSILTEDEASMRPRRIR